jgi:hypothetical protein
MPPTARRSTGGVAPVLVAAVAMLDAGCGTTKMSNTARTATEQLVLTNAWDNALRQVDFRPLAGVPVFLDTQYLKPAVDEGWITSSIRQTMLAQGVLLRQKPEEAQWIVEARVGTYGTNEHNWLFGVPQVNVPPTLTGVPTGAIPEIPIAKKSYQQGVAKMALFAYDRASGQVTWTSGTMLATADAKDVYIGGLGPIQSGSIREGPEFIGVRLPTLSDPEDSEPSTPPRGDVPFHAPTLSLPTSAADYETFAP